VNYITKTRIRRDDVSNNSYSNSFSDENLGDNYHQPLHKDIVLKHHEVFSMSWTPHKIARTTLALHLDIYIGQIDTPMSIAQILLADTFNVDKIAFQLLENTFR